MKRVIFLFIMATFFGMHFCTVSAVATTTTTSQALTFDVWRANVQAQIMALTNYVKQAVNGALPTATVAILPSATTTNCLAATVGDVRTRLLQSILDFYSYYSGLYVAKNPRVYGTGVAASAFKVQRDLLVYTLIRVSANGNAIVNSFDVETANYQPVAPYTGSFTESDIVQNIWETRT